MFDCVYPTDGRGLVDIAVAFGDIVNEPYTCTIEVLFLGDDFANASAYALTPNGTMYEACTTLQYGYKPSSNVTQLIITPYVSTDWMTPNQTPEDMQREAEQSGYLLPPEPRFSLDYPWFRLHFIAVLHAEVLLNVGLSPLGSDSVVIAPRVGSWIADAINEVIINPITKAYLAGWIMTEIAVFAGMNLGGALGFTGTFALSIGVKLGLLAITWGSSNGLKGSFFGALFSWAHGFITFLKEVVDLGITSLTDFLKISDLCFWKLLFKFLYISINIIFLIRIILRTVELGGWRW